MQKSSELFYGNWMTYTASEEHIHEIPKEITVSEISKDDLPDSMRSADTKGQPLEPPRFVSAYFAPDLTQLDALAGLTSIREALSSCDQEGQPAAVVWSSITGAVYEEWFVSAIEFFDPYDVKMGTNDNVTDEGSGFIIVPLEEGWTRQRVIERLGRIRSDITELGLTLGFKFLVNQDTFIFIRSQGTAIEMTTDQL